MRRREFIVGLGGAAAWPLAARAQQPDRMRRVGYLTGSSESNPVGQATIAAFQLELGRLGWVDGRNVRIDHRFAASRGDEGRCGRQAHVLGQPRRSDGTRGMSALPLIAARCRTAIGGAPGQLRAGGLGERYPEVMTRRLVTLAYPVLAAANKAAIDSFRAEHDAHYVGVVEAHFTMVFEAEGLDEHDYLNHVGTIAATASPISFHCRYAMLGADDGEGTAYVFLVPDEGNSAISLLHDRLYTGVLISKMRLDLKYIPHITIGRCSDRLDAKALCDSLNMQGVSIAGRIDELTVAAVDRDKVEKLRSFKLGAGS